MTLPSIPPSSRSRVGAQSGGHDKRNANRRLLIAAHGSVPIARGCGLRLLLVTTSDCHFCERARLLLARLGVATHEVAVESTEAAELASRGIPLAFLPVLTDGERVIAYGRFSEKHVRRELSL